MEIFSQTRRAFLAKIIMFSGGIGLLWRYLTPATPVQRKVLARARVADIPAQGALVYRDERLALLRDGDEIYAMSLICTHLGCTITVTPERMSCPCHGSEFDLRGVVLKGPADIPLRRLKVERTADVIEVIEAFV